MCTTRKYGKYTVIFGAPGFVGVLGACACNWYQAAFSPPSRPGYEAMPHPPPCGQKLGLGGDLPTSEDIALPLGQITKVKLHPIPSYSGWACVGICRTVATPARVR